MQVYLPIAEISVNIFLLIGLGTLVGILSGMFGVGGGFLMTPLLFFIGIPPAVAVATEANQIVASSFSGALAHFKRRAVDLKMGLILLLGGLLGASAGVYVFKLLNEIGQVELLVKICYVVFLGIIGFLMFFESLSSITRQNQPQKIRKIKRHTWVHRLPLKMRFRTSNLYISAIPPFVIGILVGILAAIMGVGGGFIMVPAMIYIIGMPTKLIPGTSLFVTIFVSAIVTILHAFNYGSIDLILVAVLICGSILGVQIGQKIGEKVDSSEFKTILAVLLLLVGIAIAYDSFFAEEVIKEVSNNGTSKLGPVSQFVRDLSKNVPVLYGMASIVLALVLGVGAAIIRKQFSHLRKKYFAKAQ